MKLNIKTKEVWKSKDNRFVEVVSFQNGKPKYVELYELRENYSDEESFPEDTTTEDYYRNNGFRLVADRSHVVNLE